MYFRVIKECTFDGVVYCAGDVIDRADPAICARLQQELRHAAVLTNDPRPVVVDVVAEPESEPIAPEVPVKAKRGRK